MKKLTIIAIAFMLSATMFTGCRNGNNTNMPTTQDGSNSQSDSTNPGSGARGGNRDTRNQDEGMQDQIGQQRN